MACRWRMGEQTPERGWIPGQLQEPAGQFRKTLPVTGPAARVSRETIAEEGTGGDGNHGADWVMRSGADRQVGVECESGCDGTESCREARHGRPESWALRRMIAAGTYYVSSFDLAAKLLQVMQERAQRAGPLDADMTPVLAARAGLCYVVYSICLIVERRTSIVSRMLQNNKVVINGGETEIRTLDTLRYTRFPSVRLKPLGHLSAVVRTVRIYHIGRAMAGARRRLPRF